MSTDRPVQSSMWPELVPARPFGPILPSVLTGSNAELLAAVAPFYLTGSVLDATYGRGGWWRVFRPVELIAHDLELDGVDFRALPEPSSSVDTVCFDPPYVPAGAVATSTVPAYRARYGITYRTPRELEELIVAGLTECARVARRWLLVKCCDYTNNHRLVLGHATVLAAAAALELGCHDLIVHHTGAGPGGHNIVRPVRARRHHSYLLVFAV